MRRLQGMVSHDVPQLMAERKQHSRGKARRDEHEKIAARCDGGPFVLGVLELADNQPVKHPQALRKIDRRIVDLTGIEQSAKLDGKPLGFGIRLWPLQTEPVEPIGKALAGRKHLERSVHKARESIERRFTF